MNSWRWMAPAMIGGAVVYGLVSQAPHQKALAVPEIPSPVDLSSAFRVVAAKAIPSVVSIETVTKSRQVEGPRGFDDQDEFLPFREFFRNDPRMDEFFRRPRVRPEQRGQGSGFVIDADGLIMTNGHVVRDADEVKVRLSDGREFVATEIKTDPRTDVAVLRIQGAGSLPALRLGDSQGAQIGDWVVAIGSPFGLEASVTAGIISAKSRGRGITQREDFLQTDAAINPGNSGGPLLNLSGEVIGINTAIASRSGGYDGIGFAVPIHLADWVAKQLVANGSVRRGYIGTQISVIDAARAKQLGTSVRQGVLVAAVNAKSPAEKAGVEPGDVLLSMNGQPVDDPKALQAIVERLDIGQAYPAVVLRDGEKVTLKVTIEAMPEKFDLALNDEDTPEKSPEESAKSPFGLELAELTPERARQLGIAATQGLIIMKVQSGSIGEQAGLSTGDVIERVGRVPVTSIAQFNELIQGQAASEGIFLQIRTANGRRLVILQGESVKP